MKILIIVDDYLPDSIKVGAKMMHELSCELIKLGHKVTVITPSPSISEAYTVDLLDGISVYRFKSGKIKNVSKIKRAINESVLSLRALFTLRKFFLNNPQDFIIYYSPSIFFGLLVKQLKKKWNSGSYLILRDFFPQWAVDGGLLRESSLITKFFRYFENLNYKAADTIGIQSPGNVIWFKQHYSYPDKSIEVLYNWVENKKIESSDDYRKKWNLKDKIIYFYGGNIGHAQDMLNLVRLAEKMKKYDKAHFVFLGKGDEYNLVSDAIERKKLTNVTLLPAVSQEDFKKILAEVDIGLFSLHRSHKTHNFPGKLLGYMVNELPILGSINPGNDLKEIVEEYNAGFVTVNGEDEKFYQNACELLDDNVRKKIGKNAKKLLYGKFSVTSAVETILASSKKE